MNKVSKTTGILASLIAFGLFSGCAGDREEYDAIRDITEAYELALKAMNGQNYRKAITIFEALQARSIQRICQADSTRADVLLLQDRPAG